MFAKKVDETIMIAGGVSALLIIAIMNLMSPDEVSPLGILIFFGLIYVICLALSLVISRLIESLIFKIDVVARPKKNNRLFYLMVISLAPVILLAMQSIHDLGVLDFILVSLAVIIICFYIKHR